jgi:O-phosphoseryl-tRNA(Cys) synthetase
MYYKNYCKVLSEVITAVKRLNYEKQMRNLNNKMKTSWVIIHSEIGRNAKNDDVHFLNIDGMNINNQQSIVKVFSNYFPTMITSLKII